MTETAAEKKQVRETLTVQRGYYPSDLHFILHTWLKGLYLDNEWFRQIPKKIFYPNYEKILKHLLAQPETKVIVTCLQEDPEIILGYAILKQLPEDFALHFTFVKPIFRRLGIMRAMLKPYKIAAVTHLTREGKLIKPPRMIFNPFL